MNQDQLNNIRIAAGLAPVYKREEREHLAEKSQRQAAEKQSLTEAANNRAPATALAQIARQHLGIRNLKAQNSDSLDFHEVSVWGVEAALKAAYKAGQQAAQPANPVKEGDASKDQMKNVGVEYDPKGGERYPAADKKDPEVKEGGKGEKKGKSAENYKTPKNKTAKQMTEAKAKKDYDGDGKVETSEEEHKGSVDKAIKKSKGKKKVNEMDLDLDMGDEGGMGDMKSRRMDLIKRAAKKVRGDTDMGDMGDDADFEPTDDMDLSGSEEGDMDSDEYSDDEMSGEMDFGGEDDMGDIEWEDNEDIACACKEFQPENEEEFATGFSAFTSGRPDDGTMGSDFKNGYETARFSRMAAVAEGSSNSYNNPKGKKGLNPIKGAKKTGADEKKGCMYKDKPSKDNSEGYNNPKGKKGLGKIKEGATDATVFDKDYHSPVGANGEWDMAQHEGEPHVQGRGLENKVKVPSDIKKSLKEEIADLRQDAGKVRYRDEYRADFYENTAEVFEALLKHLEEGTRHSMNLAQIDMNRVMSPMTHRLPRDVYMYIVRGGKPASLGELFHEVRVKDGGVDPSKEDYNS